MAHADADGDTGARHTAVVSGEQDRGRRRKWAERAWSDVIPWFVYILTAYIAVALVFKAIGINTRAVWFDLGGFAVSWAELMPIAAALVAMRELRRVATPGIDNIDECFEMLAVFLVQLVVFALAAAQVRYLSIFATSEFFWLMIISGGQTYSAFKINAATLIRTIAPSGN